MRSLIVGTLVFASTLMPVAADTFGVNIAQSHATFSVQHVLVERVTGRIPIVSADVSVAADGVTPTAVDATLDPRRIDTADSDRDGDLQGSDWFDTAKFPLWTFKSTRVEPKGGNTYAVTGILTIHGVGVPVTLAVAAVAKAPHAAYHATTTVDRHAFGMVVTRVDPLVGNAVTIDLDVQLR